MDEDIRLRNLLQGLAIDERPIQVVVISWGPDGRRLIAVTENDERVPLGKILSTAIKAAADGNVELVRVERISDPLGLLSER